MYKTEVFTNTNQLAELKSEWNDLLNRSTTNTIFLTWEWINSWWQVFGNSSELLLITVREDNDILVGLAPLMLRKRRFYTFPISEITFIGSGLSDRQDFLISNDDPKIIDAILQEIYKKKKKWTLIYFDQVPTTSLLLKEKLFKKYPMVIEDSSICPYIPIQDSWEGFYKSLSKKMRRDLSNKLNKFKKTGNWQFVVNDQVQDINNTVEAFKKIEEGSRKSGTQKEYFINKDNMKFIQIFLEFCLKNNWLDISNIILDNKIISILLGYIYHKKYYAYFITFDEDFYNLSPGKIILNEKIKWCFNNNEKITEFDFSRGDSYIKSRWATLSRQHQRLIIFKRTIYSKLIEFIVGTIRPLIKKYILKRDTFTNRNIGI
jgi:CelD/BcsL family acetyltransferase involved in cellulose biosynthesis